MQEVVMFTTGSGGGVVKAVREHTGRKAEEVQHNPRPSTARGQRRFAALNDQEQKKRRDAYAK